MCQKSEDLSSILTCTYLGLHNGDVNYTEYISFSDRMMSERYDRSGRNQFWPI